MRGLEPPFVLLLVPRPPALAFADNATAFCCAALLALSVCVCVCILLSARCKRGCGMC